MKKIQESAQFFKALSDPTRLKIIALLIWTEELCVCDIENVLELSQSKASRHLRYLLNSGILSDERKNVWVYYSINKNLPENSRNILNLFIDEDRDEAWRDLKIKLAGWIEKKQDADSCTINGENK